jgi:hypothetical protein
VAKKSAVEQRIEELDKLRKKGVVNEEEYGARRAAILADTSEPAAKGSGARGIFKWGFFGCLGMLGGLVAVVVVLVVIIAVAAGGSDSESGPDGDVHVALAVNANGDIAAAGNGDKRSKVTILQVADEVTSSNQFSQPAEGKKWWGVEVVVENVGSKQVSSLDWKLRDSKDMEHNEAFVVGAGEGLEVAYHDLNPGGKVQGWVYFEIDADATPKWLRADPNPFLSNDLYFDVQ